MKKIIVAVSIVFVFIISYSIYLNKVSENKIVIGTKNFTEQKIIGYYLETVIEDKTDYEVDVLPGIGETNFLNQALISQEIDIYVDYTSTAYQVVLEKSALNVSQEEIKDVTIKEYSELFSLEWVSMLGFDNSNAIICSEFCTKNNITNLTELAEYSGVKIGAQAESFSREDGVKLLNSQYGLENTKNVTIDHGLIYTALDNNELDTALAYTTDGQLADDKYVILDDDLNKMVKYDAGVVVRNSFKKENPDVYKVLEDTNNIFTNDIMQSLNYKVDIKKEKPKNVAQEYYEKNVKIN